MNRKTNIQYFTLVLLSITLCNNIYSVSVKEINEQINNFNIEISAIKLNKVTTNDLIFLQQKINYLRQDINGIRNETIQNIIQTRFYPIEQEVYCLLLSKNSNSSFLFYLKNKNLKKLRNSLVNLIKKKQLFLSYSEFNKKLEKVPNSLLKQLDLVDENKKKIKYTQWFTTIDSTILKVEKLIYEKLTPDKSIKQLEEYITQAPYNVTNYNKISPFWKEAFIHLFNKYTVDGEPHTIGIFKDKKFEFFRDQSSSNINYRLFQEETFQTYYIEALFLSNQKIAILKAEQTYENLAQFLNGTSTPKGIDVVILQKLIQQDLELKLYKNVLNKLKRFEFHFLPNQELHKQYLSFIESIKKLQTTHLECNITSTGIYSDDMDNFGFFFNSSGDKLITTRTGRQISIYKTDSLENSPQLFMDYQPNNYHYQFVGGQFTQIPNELKLKSIRNSLGQNVAIKDIYIKHLDKKDNNNDKQRQVMLFVSTSSKLSGGEEKANEKALPWFSSDSPEIRRARQYRSRENGYHNTDIYYSFKEGVNWSIPKLLMHVNTPYSERSPSLSADHNTLYFSSEGYVGQGGYDIYKVPIIISENNKSIEIVGTVENYSSANSNRDEIYYRQARLNHEYFIRSKNASNKEWEISQITKSKKLEKMPYRIVTINGEQMKIGLQCFPSPINEDYVNVHGYILDENDQPLKDSEITFLELNGDKEVKTFSSILGKKGKYHGTLDAGKDYRVVATGTKHGRALEYRSDDFINVCKKMSLRYIPEMGNKEKEVFDTLKNAPFFFDFNDDDVDVTRLDFNEMKKHYLKDFNLAKKNKNISFLIVGYTDTLGDLATNQYLGLERAKKVREFLIKEFDYKGKITCISNGETTKFNKTKNEHFTKHLNPTHYSSIDSALLQKNRRAMVVMVNNSRYYNASELTCSEGTSIQTFCTREVDDSIGITIRINPSLDDDELINLTFLKNSTDDNEIKSIDNMSLSTFSTTLPSIHDSRYPCQIIIRRHGPNNNSTCTVRGSICSPNF